MKRGDNADLSGLNLPEQPYRSEVFYGKGGNIVDESAMLLKVMTVGKWEVYFAWFIRNVLYDPYGTELLRRTQQETVKTRKISKETYENYMKYLKTKNALYLNRARRSSLEIK